MPPESQSSPNARSTSQPKPSDTLCNEAGETAYWLASTYSLEDIAEEWDYLFGETPIERAVGRVWLRPRWTTAEERADEDLLYDLFGDYEISGCDTTVFYDEVKPGSGVAYLYWSTDFPPKSVDGQGQEEAPDA